VFAEDNGDVGAACSVLGLNRASFYRFTSATEKPQPVKRAISKRALSIEERHRVLAVMNEDRFADQAPRAIYAKLLDEGIYLCSVRTMYRILAANNQVRERRNQLRHPNYKKPELIATAPNQVWSWDITKLKGPVKWSYFYLYVIMDIYSRHVVGWMVATRETAKLAKQLIRETCHRQEIGENELVIHSDRGSPMTSKTVALLLADLGVIKSVSRPHVSDDNPFSESQFKTMKYRPTFPKRFGSIQDARAFGQTFFDWYNNEHYHSGIALMTPAQVHYGGASECSRKRQDVLDGAHMEHPERFVRGQPKVLELPEAVWINPPKPVTRDETVCATASSVEVIGAVR